jgi:hypothetical protein
MSGFAAAILLTALALLTCGSQAEEKTGGSGYIPAPLLPGIGAHDPHASASTSTPCRGAG